MIYCVDHYFNPVLELNDRLHVKMRTAFNPEFRDDTYCFLGPPVERATDVVLMAVHDRFNRASS
jgi:hypothetical protein